jgi:hypothetical protein
MLYEDKLALLLVWSQSTDRYVAPRSSYPVLSPFRQQRGDHIIYVSAKEEGYGLAMRVQKYMAMHDINRLRLQYATLLAVCLAEMGA